MNFEAGFLSDNTYGVKHINRLVRSLVTKGIVDYPFPEDESDIGAFNINGFIQFLSEDGVIPETCKSMLVEKTDTGYVLNPGMAFLDNGIYIFVEEAQEFTCEPGMKVYWMHNSLTDKVEFMCAADYPASGSYLPLAEILADGTVSNVRKSARAKLPGMVSDYNKTKHISFSEEITFNPPMPNGNLGITGNTTIDLGGNTYKYFLIHSTTLNSWALINWETNKILMFKKFSNSSSSKSDELFRGEAEISGFKYDVEIASSRYVRFEIKENGKVIVFIADTNYEKASTRTVTFELYVF